MAGGARILDLTRDRTRDEQTNRLPGASVGSNGPAKYALPLSVRDLKVTPDPADSEYLIYEMTLTNVGEVDFLLPRSLDARRIEEESNRGRRVLLFEVRVTGGSNSQTTVVQTADGAETVPESWLRLRPQEAISVRLRGRRQQLSVPKYTGGLILVPECEEWTIGDGGFMIARLSETVAGPAVTYNP